MIKELLPNFQTREVDTSTGTYVATFPQLGKFKDIYCFAYSLIEAEEKIAREYVKRNGIKLSELQKAFETKLILDEHLYQNKKTSHIYLVSYMLNKCFDIPKNDHTDNKLLMWLCANYIKIIDDTNESVIKVVE